jgi:CheY-like chemotaxis protein
MNGSLHTLDRETQEEPVSDAVKNASRRATTVLLVDDQPGVREFMGAILRDMGCVVLEAGDGEQALRVFQRSRGRTIDLLLTDLVMPGMGGKQLAHSVESLYPTTRIVFCSAYPEKLEVRIDMVDNRIPFLQKPVTTNVLKLKVREVLGDVEEDLRQRSDVALQNQW